MGEEGKKRVLAFSDHDLIVGTNADEERGGKGASR